VSPRLVDRDPVVPPETLVEGLVPPPHFADARFETYRPDPAHPSQARALMLLRQFAGTLEPRKGMFGRRKEPEGRPGVYLDGGFGVGKTHLLTSLWHAAPEPTPPSSARTSPPRSATTPGATAPSRSSPAARAT
jgi:cell division protein ZapE